MTALQRLLKHPHGAVFDKDPHAEPLLRLRSEAGLSWHVADEVLSVASGDRELTYDLSAYTVGQLAARLQQDGLEVGPISAQFAGLQSTVLVEGAGDQMQSSGDRISGFTNLLWSLYAAYAKESREAGQQVREALRQMVITQAEGEWLDLWGTLYNEPRRDGEIDHDYAPRIPQEAFRIRVNALAIERAIKDVTGKDVRIEEPWELMFRLDESQLSGSHRLYNGKQIGPHLIRPVAAESFDWTDVLAVIERNRAAGVLVLPPESRLGRFVDASIDGTIWSGLLSAHATFVQFWADSRLDYLILSGEEITRNWPVMMSQLLTFANSDPLLDPYSLALRRTIAKASVVLSDGFALGDINSVLPRRELTQGGGAMATSDDLELSSVDQRPVWKPVDFISTAMHARGELDTGGPVAFSGIKPSIIISSFADASINGTVSASVTAGFTWVTAAGWGDFPWTISQQYVTGLESASMLIDQYANYTLKGDLE